MSNILDRLRSASIGYKEWRVQNPTDGAYCMSFSRRDSINPERDAREWLEDHQRVYPESRFSQYVVACVDMLTDGDRLVMEAADEITRLRAQVAGLEDEMEAARQVMRSVRVFVTSREKIKHPEGTEWFDSAVSAIDAALAARKGEA